MTTVLAFDGIDPERQLLDPGAWVPVIERFARSCRLAVQLFDGMGRALTRVVNEQEFALALHTGVADGERPLGATKSDAEELACRAIRSGQLLITTDDSGLGYVAVPLKLAERGRGALIAGQVFLRFPDQLALDRMARKRGLPSLWAAARRERPISQALLTRYGELLLTLGQAFLEARHSELLRLRESQEQIRQRAEELEAVLAATPAVILIAHDAACERITGNRRGYELFRARPGENLSLTGSAREQPRDFRILQGGAEVAVRDLPLQRAARGEMVQGVELEIEFTGGAHIALTGGAVPLADADGNVRGAVGAFMDTTTRKALEAQQALLIRELQHRTKNLLAVVQSVVANSLANDRASTAVSESIFGRLKALAYAQDLVVGMGESGVLLSKLIGAELGSIAGRFALTGPDVSLDPGVAQNLALVLHELTTNAIKYGSLSSAAGTVTINSSLGSEGHLILTWAEHGGPRVNAPQRMGFGSQLIEQAFSSDSRSRAAVSYNSEGVEARFEIPLKFVHDSEGRVVPAERPRESAAASLQGLSVLIVEDELLIALEAEAELLGAGTGAMTRAHSIEEAERCISSAPFDVAILDVNLNGRPSFPLADLLADRGISFVFASGYSHLDGLPERWRSVPLVNKPYSRAELVAAIAQARRHLHA
ncbi:MAG TPA: HWE histidine kinase domain-containing protein [Xanthobacteraceae bacterium]|nr:HWE histidine kinase domain-containing protein [Xanthobacteraceae bacterium]